jgi:hypothetical protein
LEQKFKQEVRIRSPAQEEGVATILQEKKSQEQFKEQPKTKCRLGDPEASPGVLYTRGFWPHWKTLTNQHRAQKTDRKVDTLQR